MVIWLISVVQLVHDFREVKVGTGSPAVQIQHIVASGLKMCGCIK